MEKIRTRWQYRALGARRAVTDATETYQFDKKGSDQRWIRRFARASIESAFLQTQDSFMRQCANVEKFREIMSIVRYRSLAAGKDATLMKKAIQIFTTVRAISR